MGTTATSFCHRLCQFMSMSLLERRRGEVAPMTGPQAARLNPSTFMGPADFADGIYDFLKQWLPRTGRLADLGCGRGRFLLFAARRGLEVLGVDDDEWSISQCQEIGVQARLSTIWEFLQPGSETFEVISAIHLVEHFQPADLTRMLVGVKKKLQPGGRFLVVTPNFKDRNVSSEIFWLDRTHVRPYPLPLLAGMCEEQGLRVIHQSTEVLVRLGKRRALQRPVQRLRFGREFDRMNAVLVAEAQ